MGHVLSELLLDSRKTEHASQKPTRAHSPNQKSELRQAVHGRLGDPVELVEKPGRAPVPSFGVGSCVYLDRPLGNKLRLIFAAVALDRPPDGLRTDLLTVFKVIEKLRGIVGEERVPSAAIQ